jgi:hypothetical protein
LRPNGASETLQNYTHNGNKEEASTNAVIKSLRKKALPSLLHSTAVTEKLVLKKIAIKIKGISELINEHPNNRGNQGGTD